MIRSDHPRAVLFDWDGTIVDSAAASYRVYVALFGHFGLSFDQTIFARTYSPNWYLTYEAVGLARELWSEADLRWTTLYAEESCELIPGVLEALARLTEAGILAAVVTSGDRERVNSEVEALGCGSVFSAIVCSQDSLHKKPHPDPLLIGLDRLGVEGTQAIYVGDSPEDIEMARRAGVRSVAIPGNFPNHDALRSAGADWHVQTLKEAINTVLGHG